MHIKKYFRLLEKRQGVGKVAHAARSFKQPEKSNWR